MSRFRDFDEDLDDEDLDDPRARGRDGGGGHGDGGGRAAAGPGGRRYDDAGYDAGYGAAGYGDDGYRDRGYAEPEYAQPGYAQPGYAEPGYVEPGHSDAGYDDGAYDDDGGYRDFGPDEVGDGAAYEADPSAGGHRVRREAGPGGRHEARPAWQDDLDDPDDPRGGPDRALRGGGRARDHADGDDGFDGFEDEFDRFEDDDEDDPDDALGLLGDHTAALNYRRARRARRVHERRRSTALPKLAAMLLVLALLVGGGIYGVGRVLHRFTGSTAALDWPGPGSGAADVRVAAGATSSDIAKALFDAGVVRSRAAFVNLAAADQRSLRIQPGTYRLAKQMSAAGALTALLEPGKNSIYRFTIAPGTTVRAVITELSKRLKVPLATYQQIVHDPVDLHLPDYAGTVVEGYLFPSTYELDPAQTPVQTLQMFIDRFKAEAKAINLESRAAAGNVSPSEVVIIASIVEREVANPSEGPMAARVIYNRLNDTTGSFRRLDMDSTTRYGLDEYEGPLTQSQLNGNNPYNTRKIVGLPPGSISNPGTWALESALAPAPGNWEYFVSLPQSKKTIFASTDAEWQAALRQYRAEGGQDGG